MKRESIIQGVSLCAVLILVILAPGCETTLTMYKGEKLPIQEIAVIKESSFPRQVRICSVDEELLKCRVSGFRKVEVMPGLHKVIVSIQMATNELRGGITALFVKHFLYYCVLEFTAETGHQYKIKAGDLVGDVWEGSRPSIVLVDIQSGAVIAAGSDCRPE